MSINANGAPLPRLTIQQANKLVGRCILKAETNFTVTAASTSGEIHVWNPDTKELITFDSFQTFANWAYGTPIPSGYLGI